MNASRYQINADDVSLGEFLKRLILELQQMSVPMPFQNEEKWHALFYELKSAHRRGRPPFLKELRFDWDGPYPRCQDLSECLQTLHWNGFVSVNNPSYDRLNVDADVLNGMQDMRPPLQDENLKIFLDACAKRASELFK